MAGTSWTAYNLLQVYDDGTYIDYSRIINTPNRSPRNWIMDEENEKFTFRHVDRYNSEWFTEYEIDTESGMYQIPEISKNIDIADIYINNFYIIRNDIQAKV